MGRIFDKLAMWCQDHQTSMSVVVLICWAIVVFEMCVLFITVIRHAG